MSWYQSDINYTPSQPLEIVTWADGTDEQIVAMLEAHYNGDIDIHDYWAIGDERTVSLSAMDAMSPLTDTHAAQNVTFVLSEIGGKTSPDYTIEYAFQVDQKNCLNEVGKMNTSNVNGWKDCPRRTWCNTIYYNAIPETLRPIFKQFRHFATKGSGNSSFDIIDDYFSFRSEYEVFGYNNYSLANEGAYITWYKTSSNRGKRQGSYETWWWERSSSTSGSGMFCAVSSAGDAESGYATQSYTGIAPFGCI